MADLTHLEAPGLFPIHAFTAMSPVSAEQKMRFLRAAELAEKLARALDGLAIWLRHGTHEELVDGPNAPIHLENVEQTIQKIGRLSALWHGFEEPNARAWRTRHILGFLEGARTRPDNPPRPPEAYARHADAARDACEQIDPNGLGRICAEQWETAMRIWRGVGWDGGRYNGARIVFRLLVAAKALQVPGHRTTSWASFRKTFPTDAARFGFSPNPSLAKT